MARKKPKKTKKANHEISSMGAAGSLGDRRLLIDLRKSVSGMADIHNQKGTMGMICLAIPLYAHHRDELNQLVRDLDSIHI